MDKNKIEHIAKLARLQVSDSEAEHYAGELTKVFGYIDELKMVNTDDVTLTTSLSGLANQLRNDKIEACPKDERERSLAQTDRDEQGRVKVKKIL